MAGGQNNGRPSGGHKRASRRFPVHSIIQQNWQGLKNEARLCEMFEACKRHGVFAACGQETWRAGNDMLEQDGYTFIGVGPQRQSRRGSLGVSITLSRRASDAWKRAGRELHVDLGPRLMAVRLEVRCGRRGKGYHRKMGIFLISAYAPTSGHPAADHAAYYAAFHHLLARRQPEDVLVACVDANASIGRGSLGGDTDASGRAGAVGPFGLPRLNTAGRCLRDFLETQQLASLASFYRKQHYGTWIHPRFHSAHQLDHILVSRAHLCRFTDAGSCPFQLVSSDHRAVGCRMRFEASLQRKAVVPRNEMLRLDCSSLYEPAGQQAFARSVMQRVRPARASLQVGSDGWVSVTVTAAPSGQTQIDPARPSLSGAASDSDDDDPALRARYTAEHGTGWWNHDPLFHAYRAELHAYRASRATAAATATTTTTTSAPSIPYSIIADALRAVAFETLSNKPKPQPPWFEAREAELEGLIAQLNATLNAHHRSPSPATAEARRLARAQLQTGLRAAKSAWVLDKCQKVNDGIIAQRGTSTAWNLVSELRDGLCGVKRRSAPANMRKSDGTLASTPTGPKR